MGIIKTTIRTCINRPKVYILTYKDYDRTNFDDGHKFILGYFTSKENATDYVKQLIDNRTLVPVKLGVNKSGKDIIRYVKVSEYGIPLIKKMFNLIIEYHEMDLTVDEVSYYGITYPDAPEEYEIELKEP